MDEEQISTNEDSSNLDMKPKFQIRHDWYQTDVAVVITVLVKNVQEKYLKLNILKNEVTVDIADPDYEHCNICLNLSNSIIPEQSSYKLTPSKIEIKLKKCEGFRWEKLEGTPKVQEHETHKDCPPSYPTSKVGKDWNKVEKEIKEQEQKDKCEGDEAVNKLFQEIYGKGSDEVKRAMNKSFMESNGTVLSTNWDEICKKKVDVKPPDGMEWKKF